METVANLRIEFTVSFDVKLEVVSHWAVHLPRFVLQFVEETILSLDILEFTLPTGVEATQKVSGLFAGDFVSKTGRRVLVGKNHARVS